jgi:uncharacterized membrane protein YqjE
MYFLLGIEFMTVQISLLLIAIHWIWMGIGSFVYLVMALIQGSKHYGPVFADECIVFILATICHLYVVHTHIKDSKMSFI